MAGGAFLAGHDKGDFLLDPLAARLAEAALQIRDDAFELVKVGAGAKHALALHLNTLVTRAVQQGVQGLLAEVLNGGIECKAVALAQRLIGHFGDGALGVIPAAGLDGAFPDGLALVGDDTRRVYLHEGAETRTLLAGTEGIVEAEHPRGQLLDGDAVLGAGVALAEHHRFTANDVDDDKPVCLRQRGFYGIGQTPADRVVDDQTVHDDLNGVLDVLFEVDLLAQIVHIAVDAHAGKTGSAGGIQLLGLGALAGTHNGGQHLKAGALRQLHDFVDHLVHGLLGNLPPTDRAVGHADAGVHQTQIVVNLRYRSHRGTRVVACCFLVDGDGRGQAGDLVDIGLFHLAQKLAGIAGKAFHIAALAVGIDRVKRQARLAGAGQAGHDDQLISGQLQIDVFQVMLPRTLDDNAVVRVDFDFGAALCRLFFGCCTQFLYFLLPLRVLAAALRSLVSAAVGSSPRSSR